jgi:hypothetical protein
MNVLQEFIAAGFEVQKDLHFFYPFLLYPYTGVEIFLSFFLIVSQTVGLLGRVTGPS